MNVIKDLGVNFDPDLSFVLHCHKINKAYAMLGIIMRNFMYSSEVFVLLYKALVRYNWNMLILYGIHTEWG